MTERDDNLRVLFVCMGNICRSPTAAGVFAKLVSEAVPHLQVEIDSAGTHSYHVGAPPDRRAQAAAARRGIDLSEMRARLVEDADFETFDLVLAMDRDNLEHMHRRCPDAYRDRVHLFLEYAGTARMDEVPDPYYGAANGFDFVLDLVEEGGRGLLQRLATITRRR